MNETEMRLAEIERWRKETDRRLDILEMQIKKILELIQSLRLSG